MPKSGEVGWRAGPSREPLSGMRQLGRALQPTLALIVFRRPWRDGRMARVELGTGLACRFRAVDSSTNYLGFFVKNFVGGMSWVDTVISNYTD
jgi:hypothetical protein